MMKNRLKRGKHRKFQDDWERSQEPVVEGVTFYVKYLGVEIVNLPNDETHTTEAIKKIIHRARYGSGKVRKVALTVTPTSLKPYDLETNEDLEEITIHRISYCTADKNNEKVFGFISCHFRTEVLECHAYLCNKRKVAEALTLTVAQAFNIAFDNWKKTRVEKTSTGLEEKDDSTSDDYSEPSLSETGSPHRKSAPQAIPGCATESTHSPQNGSTQSCWTPGASPISPPSIQPPPRTIRVLTVKSDAPLISSSAPPSMLHLSNHAAGKHRPPPLVFHGNGHHHVEDKKAVEKVASSFTDLKLEEDVDLEDCFSQLAESRSNPGLLDINVRRSQFDADVIVHFSGTDKDRQTLLESESKDSLLLRESKDNIIFTGL